MRYRPTHPPEIFLRLSPQNILLVRQGHKKNESSGHQMKSSTHTMHSGRQTLSRRKKSLSKHVVFQSIFFFPLPRPLSKISFDDPLFRSFYVLNGPAKYFEAKGEGIFQGNVWVHNASDQNLQYTATEILV